MDEVPVRMHSGGPPKLSRRTSSRMAESDMAQLLGRGVSIKRALLDEGRDMYSRTSIVEEQAYNAKKKENPVLSLPEVKMYGETLVWADYYNNLLKCWEPFVEPLSVIAIHEKVCMFIFENAFEIFVRLNFMYIIYYVILYHFLPV